MNFSLSLKSVNKPNQEQAIKVKQVKQKDFYPLIGRIKIAIIVEKLKGNKSNQELADFLNQYILDSPEFSYIAEITHRVFNRSNIRRLLLAGEEEESSFEVGLLQFIAPHTDFNFGELMSILANTGSYRMSAISSLMFRAIREHGLSEDQLQKRLQRLQDLGFGISWQLFNDFRQGQIPTEDNLRVIKEVVDPHEHVISEAQWIEALLQDRRRSHGGGPHSSINFVESEGSF